ncbi:hypothetical protein NDU88_003945 [Pleurodeles waltl]|uniref:Uncharacterized protein n=1 Tax=Pleurodeles waltl TaxID=8319 RepID=A0AAV7W7K6_PLEWA|nr:hypothetical protein NDU88_003945 [Pleurodeles waltl]
MSPELVRHGLRASRGPEPWLRVPGGVLRLPRRVCRPQPRPQTQQPGRPLAACRAAATAGVQLRLPVWVSSSKMGEACPP